MLSSLRLRIFCALGLCCAAAPGLGCKKSDDTASGVDKESVTTKPKDKPKPTPKNWVPNREKYQYGGGGSCPTAYFCSTAPEISRAGEDAGTRCGVAAKIPKDVADEGFVGSDANFNVYLTEKVQKDEPDACCYAYRLGPCGKGRPMAHEGALVLAPEVERKGWSKDDLSSIAADVRAIADEAEISALCAHLRRVAILEHASVAAFARVSLELLALGAPAELVSAAHVAALDEIRHATTCWSLLEALEGRALGPGPMTIPPFRADDRDAVLRATVIDGCVGETFGSLVFHEAARACTVSSLAALYRSIAEEEAEHAILAFRIVRILECSRDELASLVTSARFEPESLVSIGPAHADSIARLGMLDEQAQRTLHRAVISSIVVPALASSSPDGDTSRERAK